MLIYKAHLPYLYMPSFELNWIFRSNCIMKGRPDYHWTKWSGVDRMPWSDKIRKLVNWTLRCVGYLCPWPLTLNFEDQIVSREWEAQMSWNERDRSLWDVLRWNFKKMGQLDAVLTGLPLTMTFDLECWRSGCIPGKGGPIVMERKGLESIEWSDVKHNHYVTSRQRILCWRQSDLRCQRFRWIV